jgi:hypothetical protein
MTSPSTPKKLKHSKFKNTGILFELLVRQVTSDIISNKPSVANPILQKYFNEGTELGREWKLYQLITEEKMKSADQAEKFLEVIISSRKKINEAKLAVQKFELIKEIKGNWDLEKFMASPVSNYKLFASTFKLFEEAVRPDVIAEAKEIFQAKSLIIEHMSTKSTPKSDLGDYNKTELIEMYKKQTEEMRLLSYKLLVDNFNKKYSNLDAEQKSLLREYINNVSNTQGLREYVDKEVARVKGILQELSKTITDSVIVIKLNEALAQLSKLNESRLVKDNHITALLISYELIKEIKRAGKPA